VLMFAEDLVMRREGQRANIKGVRQNGPVRCKTGVNTGGTHCTVTHTHTHTHTQLNKYQI
jgi:hypothetical protein